MGEIKSTLDLVMERTRHLTLSSEEKAEQKMEEFTKGLNGLLQKFQDHFIKIEEFRKSFASLRETHGVENDDAVLEAVVGRIGLDEDNERMLVLLDAVCGRSGEPLTSVVGEYRSTLAREAERRRQEVERTLMKTRGISGSAVVPNLMLDDVWIKESRRIKDRFNQNLTREKAGFQNS